MSSPSIIPSRSEFREIRGIRYHVRLWGKPDAPTLFLLHGWMDVSASFQFVVDALARDWRVVAPDWRGFGLSGWAAHGYWYPDYYADLECLLDCYEPDRAARLVGHSLGGVVACTFAGLRPARVARLVSLEGFGLARTTPDQAPGRYRKWLDGLRETPRFRPYDSLEAVAARLRRENPRLDDGKAHFLASHWAHANGDGRFVIRSDPRHKLANPQLFRMEEILACWKEVTAPVLWVFARESRGTGYLKDSPAQLAERKAAFRDYREAWIEEAGHMMHHDQPGRAARLIENFMTA